MNASPRFRVTLTTLLGALLSAMFGALLSACQSAPTRLYTLYAITPDAIRADYGGPPIRLDAVHFPPSLDRIEVVHDLGPGEMALSDVDHWSAPLGQTARQALSADLIARLPSAKVIYPHLVKPTDALGVSVDVLEFNTDRQGVYLQASWVVSTSGQSAAVSGGTATLHSDASAPDAAATARALSKLLGQLADRIVAGL